MLFSSTLDVYAGDRGVKLTDSNLGRLIVSLLFSYFAGSENTGKIGNKILLKLIMKTMAVKRKWINSFL